MAGRLMKKMKNTEGPQRAALYTRVSPGAHAKRDLSVPDQRRALREFCAARDWIVTAEFTDARTGRDENRPGFQQMMDDALHGEAPFDVVVVHSFSRFYRNELELGLAARALDKRGIQLVSITQEVGNDPAGVMLRQILALFDEYTSLETAKHVARTMMLNARQGFFNGGTVPFGFEAPILIPVPPIISADDFDKTQRTLKSRNPKKLPPKIVSSPVLLAGLATCPACGNGMLLSTGKSGKYR